MLNLIRDTLAAYRLASLLVREAGPFSIFSRLREFAGISYNVGTGKHEADNEIGKMLLCMWCTSVWAGAAMLFLPEKIKNMLALSAGAILIYLNEEDLRAALVDAPYGILRLCERLQKHFSR